MDWLKGPAAALARSRLGELLDKVRVSLLGGVAPRETDWLSTCKFWPIFWETLTVRFGAETVAVMEVFPAPLGVAKFGGVVITRFEVPAVSG